MGTRPKEMGNTLARKVDAAFAPGGPLAAVLRGFEARPGQLALAARWAGALSRGNILVAEAATGIGKTLAYLVPAVLSGRRTIVSTGTRTLQQQLAENDIPQVREALKVPFSHAVVKGRANYLCRRRWDRFTAEPLFEFAREARHFDRMQAFAETTRTGDISECSGVPEELRAWTEVNARSETCDASSCGQTDRCFLAEVRRKAAAADVVIVNHHLFFADLALRLKRGGAARSAEEGGGRQAGDVLPAADALVFDEAHGIEEVASAFFGVSVSLGRALEIVRDLSRAGGKGDGAWRGVLPAAEGFRIAADVFFRAAGEEDGRFFLPERGRPDGPFDRRAGDLLRAGEELSLALSEGPGASGKDSGADAETLLRRVRSLGEDLAAVLSADPSEAVAWGERRGASVAIHRTPVEVAPVLTGGLWDPAVPTLLTSATLTVSGDLSYFRDRVGLGGIDAEELIVDNEFDFAGKAMVYVPRGLPDPGDEGFPSAAAGETADILSLSGGGALVLCTSYRTLGALKERLRDALPFTVFVQGDAPRMQLLRAFRRDGDAVLIGTGTFWEGIDVPGESLRCVVIDKLPFAPPGDPVVTARIRAIRGRGGDPFAEYQVPEAVLALRQGVGRLLRRSDDFGAIAILDHRVVTKGYGTIFRGNLPAMPWTRDRAAVAEFFGRFRPMGARGPEEGVR